MALAATLLARHLLAIYHFGRMQMPAVAFSMDALSPHMERTYALFQKKFKPTASWDQYLENLYPLDWFLTVACLERSVPALEQLISARAHRSDCLLLDALRARAVRLYPRDPERQDTAVNEFWGHLYAGARDGSKPVLERYDGQRPLVPWLIRVFQNWHVSELRLHSKEHSFDDNDDLPLPPPAEIGGDQRWREIFRVAAREALGTLSDNELLILGVRMRLRMSQRDVAKLLGVHEGTLSRQTDSLSARCRAHIDRQMTVEGWSGDDLTTFFLTEMGSVILDDPRLSADRLARILAARGKQLPQEPSTDQR